MSQELELNDSSRVVDLQTENRRLVIKEWNTLRLDLQAVERVLTIKGTLHSLVRSRILLFSRFSHREADDLVIKTARLRKRWQETPTKWSPIPVSLGAAVLVVLTFYKQASEKGKEPLPEGSVKVQGPWQVSHLGYVCL